MYSLFIFVAQHNITLEHSRANTRPRNTGLVRPLKLIREIHEISSRPDSKLYEADSIKDEIREINALYDKKKSIAIPKTASLSTQVKQKEPAKAANTGVTKAEDHVQTLFIRPSHYITYGEKKRAENSQKIKEYEATQKEIEYIRKIGFSSNEEHLYEHIITSLENDVDKGEMIPKERAIVVAEKAVPNKDKEFYENIFEVSIIPIYVGLDKNFGKIRALT